jgi:hypothetical protein
MEWVLDELNQEWELGGGMNGNCSSSIFWLLLVAT